MKKRSNFIVQGSILAIAGVLSRIIGIIRRFPMEHIIGDKGNGFYSAAYEVYALMLIISLQPAACSIESRIVESKSEAVQKCRKSFSVRNGVCYCSGWNYLFCM